MPSYVDLHLHILPGIDDGAADLDTAGEMLSILTGLGFSELHATPHQRAGMFLPTVAQIDFAQSELRGILHRVTPTPTLAVAAENYWDEVLAERWATGTIPGYAGGKAFLFELPALIPPSLDRELFQARVKGRLPVLAHPERYSGLQDKLDRAAEIGRSAALVVDLAALGGSRGRAETRTARRMIEEGLAHAAATDMHSPDDARALQDGITWLRKKMGSADLTRLLDENPRRILAGEIP